MVGTETTIFVYDGMGKLVAEYTTTGAPSSPTTSYVMTDTLQSVRAISDAQVNMVSRRDFLPFGEELYGGTANRTTTQGYSAYGADNIRKRFTGYEKDVETGLDFAEARYYNNQHGRFTAVDPLLASGKSANPQSFNRYSYVMNSPLRLTDHTGLQVGEEVPDSGVITVETNWYTSFAAFLRHTGQQLQQQFNNVMQKASNHDPLGSVNFQRSRQMFDPYPEDRHDDRLVGGIFGPSWNSVIDQTNQSYRTAATVNEIGLTAQTIWLGGTMSYYSSSMAVNRLYYSSSAGNFSTFGEGTTFTHFTDADGVTGITGIQNPSELAVGQPFEVNTLRFGFGSNTQFARNPGDIFVTDLPLNSSAGRLNSIGVFGARQQFGIQFSQENALIHNGVRPIATPNNPNIYTIPANTRMRGMFRVYNLFHGTLP